MKHIGGRFSFYSGNPSMDIWKADPGNDHLVLCASKKQMLNLRYAATRYNNEQIINSYIRIIRYETFKCVVRSEIKRIFCIKSNFYY
ncbi:MAG: hypothetical protein KBT34_14060 [Prevotella sp.]|nr:hypothetical protein [Candidatus Prevotella equi]